MDRNMMLTPDEYMAIIRLIQSERESEGSQLAQTKLGEDKPRKRRKSAYQKRYEKNFKSIEMDFKLKNGKWKKNGFRRAVMAAHRLSKE